MPGLVGAEQGDGHRRHHEHDVDLQGPAPHGEGGQDLGPEENRLYDEELGPDGKPRPWVRHHGQHGLLVDVADRLRRAGNYRGGLVHDVEDLAPRLEEERHHLLRVAYGEAEEDEEDERAGDLYDAREGRGGAHALGRLYQLAHEAEGQDGPRYGLHDHVHHGGGDVVDLPADLVAEKGREGVREAPLAAQAGELGDAAVDVVDPGRHEVRHEPL